MTYNLTVTVARAIGPGQRSANSVKIPIVITYPNSEVILTEGISKAAEVTGLSQSCITYRLHNPRPPQLIPPPGYTSIRQVPGYNNYKAAHNRCTNPTNKNYPEYGGRGILFNFNNFIEFYNEVGEKPGPEYSIDRIDNEGNYEPGNVRWATPTQQLQNRRPYRKRGCNYIQRSQLPVFENSAAGHL